MSIPTETTPPGARPATAGDTARSGGGLLGCGLSAAWLAAIFALTLAVFLLWDGPLWTEPADTTHVGRLGYSYAVAVPLVVAALAAVSRLSAVRVVTATLLIWSLKLVVTVPLYFAIAPGTATTYRPAQPWVDRDRARRDGRYAPADGAFDAGTVSGQVTADGAPAAGAAIYVAAPAPGARLSAPRTVPAAIAGARYDAPAYALTVADTLAITTRDGELHTAHLVAGAHSVVNAPLPATAEPRPLPAPAPGVYRLRCDNHRGEGAAVVVVDHPYYAIADGDGRFQLADVPAGTIELVAVLAPPPDTAGTAGTDSDSHSGSHSGSDAGGAAVYQARARVRLAPGEHRTVTLALEPPAK